MALAVSVTLPLDESSEETKMQWADKVADQFDFTCFNTSASLNPRSGFPQKIYANDGFMAVVDFLPYRKSRNKLQQSWFEHFKKIQANSNGRVVMISIQTREDCKELINFFRGRTSTELQPKTSS